jgi:hypothetical protein
MITIRLSTFFVLVAVASSQQSSMAVPGQSKGSVSEPRLPVIDYNACPFEGCTFGRWKVTKESTIYSTWQHARTVIGKLEPGEEVTGLTGVHITLKPDRILVKKPIPDLGLGPGDVILRYMFLGEGYANIWYGGSWHRQFDCTFITEKNDEGCLRDCSAVVTDVGVKDWWVKVKTSSGKTGWVLARGNFDGMDAFAELETLPSLTGF